MRTIRLAVGLAGVVCALAVTAVPAMAHEFVASKVGKLAGKGFEEIPRVAPGEFREYNPEKMQQFRFGEFVVDCYSATNKGELTTTTTEVLTINTKFNACGWYPKPSVDLHSPASFAKEGITVKYHANGFVETLPNGEEVEFKGEILPSSAYIKVAGNICKIEIPAQNIPVASIKHPEEEYSSVLYSNFTAPVGKSKEFPTGEQERILLSNTWKAIKFVYGGEGAQCTNPEGGTKPPGGSGTGGKYTGQTYVKLGGGNIKFE
jgi:hypothetical protein